MTASIDGLVSGLDTAALIEQLMSLERVSQERLVAKRDKAQEIIAAYQGLNTKLASARSSGRTLADPTFWNAMTASSSDEGVATASAGSTALGGSLTFTVGNLATAGMLTSSGTVASTASVVASSPLVVAAGGTPLGIKSLAAAAGLTVGSYTVKVTQASAGAEKTGTAPLAASTVIDATNDEIQLNINGVPTTLTIAADTYDAEGLAAAVEAASGGTLTAVVDDAGALELTTVAEGSAASIQITGGDALGALNLAVDAAAITGTDGKIEVGGVAADVTDASAGAALTVNGIEITFAGGVRTGSLTAKAVDVGDGSLAATVSAINGAKAGVSAAAVQLAPGEFKLQLTAAKTGLAGDISMAAGAFAGLGSLVSSGTATDATLTVGSGPGAYSITSSSNQITSVLPGVTITLKGTGTTTVTTAPDGEKLADAVAKLVEDANAAAGEMKALTAFDPSTGEAALLMGSFTIRQIQSRLSTAIIDAVTTSAIGSGGLAGVSVSKDGAITFDRSKFLAKFDEDPDAVAALFARGGTSTSTKVSLSFATDRTRAGTYDVEITAAATRAERVGADLGGADITAAETIDIRVGGASGTVVTYAAQAGESLDDIADGLNEQLALSNLAVLVTVESNALVVRTTGYGTGATFEVRSSNVDPGQTGIASIADVYESHAGTNVAGKINGVDGTGSGQLLSAPNSDETLAGLRLLVTATGPESSTFTYVPGIGQRVATSANDAIDLVSGSITAAIEGREAEIERLNDQIVQWDARLAQRELFLRRQFTAMEVALSAAQAQSNWLAGQIASLQANSAAARR